MDRPAANRSDLPLPLTRDQSRSRRNREVRPVTIKTYKTPQWERDRILEETREILAEVGPYCRPFTRGDCLRVPRPCPFWSCKYHLGCSISANGALKITWPDLKPWELPESCALDLADRGGMRLEDVGVALNVTRERIRQLEVKALARLEALPAARGLWALAGMEED